MNLESVPLAQMRIYANVCWLNLERTRSKGELGIKEDLYWEPNLDEVRRKMHRNKNYGQLRTGDSKVWCSKKSSPK